jgi:CRP-like cAMP-binding protein
MYQLLYQYFKEKTDISEQTFAEICPYFKSKNVRRNEILLSQGEVCKYNIFVNKGCVRIFNITHEGQEATRYFAFEGKFGTALTSLIQQEPSFEFIQSIEKSELLLITRKDFYHLADTVSEVNYVYRHILESAYITSQQRIYGFQGLSALDKLKWLMNYQPRILARLSNKMIASYLGITPYTLSRLKSGL